MGHEYLNHIKDCAGFDTCVFNSAEETQDNEFYKRQGFRVEETFALNWTYATWLYSHIKAYIEIGGKVVNLRYHKFTIDGVELTQYECCKKIISLLDEYFSLADDEDWTHDGVEQLQAATNIFSIILPAMWW